VIYADNAATTKISDMAFVKMLPFLQERYGNASSQYSFGVKAKRAVEQARRQVASAIGAVSDEITFTSGGSESNSWVLQGVAELYEGENIHIVTSLIEHHSVLNSSHALEKKGVEVTYLPVDITGRISLDDVEAVIKPNTKLVSIMFVNNEIGTIQPIAEFGQFLHGHNILFHTDAIQAVGHIPVNVGKLQVDFLTASAHKFNGAKGAGILYKSSGVALPQMIFGGDQELGMRAGTENVAAIVAAGYALEESIASMPEMTERLKLLANITIFGIKDKIRTIHVNCDNDNCLPGMINIGFDGISGDSLMHMLDLNGICVSTGSACNSGKDDPSHVLLALGQTYAQANSAIRISYGRHNTTEEAEYVVNAICSNYKKIISTL
jgi:cysteine desulfurase